MLSVVVVLSVTAVLSTVAELSDGVSGADVVELSDGMTAVESRGTTTAAESAAVCTFVVVSWEANLS